MLQTLWTWPRMIAIVVCLVLGLWIMAAAIAFGTAAPPRPMHQRQIDLTELSALSRYTARDGAHVSRLSR
jgi:hypothetical protein